MNKKLCVTDVVKKYGDKTVLDSVSFDVLDGEFLSILGPSGCGKTTLLRILIGLLEKDSGTIEKNGVDISSTPSSKRGMGIVFQNYALFQNMSVLRNVEYALTLNKVTKNIAREKALEVIEQVGLTEYLHAKPHRLSGGQQQRVAIARTLALNPEIILFDEPMSALDVETRLVLREEIKKLQNKFKTTMIYITHDQEEAFAMSDRIMVMNNAKIEQIASPEEIMQNPASDYVKDFVINNISKKIKSLDKFRGYCND